MKWWTRELSWALTALLTMLVSCGGNAGTIAPVSDVAAGGTPVNEAQPPGAAKPGPDLGGFAVAPVDSSGRLALNIEQQGGQLTVRVAAAAPQQLSELLCELRYDPAQYTPLAAQATEAIAPLNMSLCLEVLDVPGLVSLGQVALGGATHEVPAGAVLAEVLFACEPLADQARRAVSQAPAHAKALSPLLWDAQSGELTWYLVNPGDFNQDGLVGVSDLSPLGREFGASGPFAFETALSVIDGSGDGLIGIGDLALIGQYWGCHIQGYNLYASDDITEVPLSFAEPSSLEPLASFSLDQAQGDPLLDRLWFCYTPEPGQDELLYWVRPYAGQTEGTRSNVNGPGVESAAVEPGGDGFNLPPTARLSLEYSGSSVPLAVSFDAGASSDPDGAIIFYEWDYQGDGLFDAFSTGAVAQHTYIQPGTYSPLVRVTDNGGLWSTFQSPSFEVTEDGVSNIPPVADLIATATSGGVPLTVGLIATGSLDPDGYIVKHVWDFGDGAGGFDSGADPTVLHTYSDSGSFTATVEITDDRGGTAIGTAVIDVLPANQPPLAALAIGAGEEFGHAPHTVHFDAGGSSDPDGNIEKYWWDLDGDGGYDKFTLVPYYTFTFTDPGLANVEVVVEDNDGASGSASVTISTNVPGNEPPIASLSPSLSYGDVPLIVWFDAGSSFDPDGSIALYEWDWEGDGAFDADSLGASATHTYSSWGLCHPVVRVTDNKGAQATCSTQVRANEVHNPWSAWPMFGHDIRHTCRSPYVGAQTSNVKWVYSLAGRGGTPSLAPDGSIVVCSRMYDNKIHAISPLGSHLWTYETSHWLDTSVPAIGPSGTIHVGTDDNTLYALEQGGSMAWSYSTEPYGIVSGAVVGPDGIIYITSNDAYLYAFNPDGTLRWNCYTGAAANRIGPVLGRDGTVYIGGNSFLAVSPDGVVQWEYEIPYSVSSSASIGTDETIYFGYYEWTSDAISSLCALSPDGEVQWVFPTNGHIRSCPAIGADGTIYIGSGGRDNCIHAVNPDGTEKWAFSTDDGDPGTDDRPTDSGAVDADGTFYIGCYSGIVLAIEANGTLKWSYDIGFNPSACVIGADGTVYVGSGEWALYAFGAPPPE